MDEALAIIEHTEGPAAVIAAAGSGKTRVAIERAARLIKQEQPVLLLTFSAAAAENMRSRLFSLTGGLDKARVHTYHGLALFLLRRFGAGADVPTDFDLLTPAEETRLLRRLLAQTFGTDDQEDFASQAGRIADLFHKLRAEHRLEDFPQQAANLSGWQSEGFQVFLEALGEEKQRLGVLAFEDLIELAPRVLGAKGARAWAEENARFVIVDEYQDTSAIQERMLTALVPGEDPNLMAIGDPNQAIYGWRGAGHDTFERFLARYPSAKIYALRKNHRSQAAILKAAEAAIAPLYKKGQETFYHLVPTRPAAERPTFVHAANPPAEARTVARAIEQVLNAGGSPQDVAVISRTSQGLFLIEGELLRRGIPVRALGGMRLTERREVKVMLRFFKGAIIKRDAALAAFMEDAVPGLGSATVVRLVEAAEAAKVPLADWLLDQGPERLRLTKRATAGVALVRTMIAFAHERFAEATPAEAFSDVIEALVTDFLPDLLRRMGTRGPDATTRRQNLDRLTALAEAFFASDEGGHLKDFLDHLSVVDLSIDEAVTLTTVHAAKGLEWPMVFITGLVEGHFPSLGGDADLKEERRLFYVALTRAKDELMLTAPRFAAGGKPLRLSRFAEELLQNGLIEPIRIQKAA